MDAYEKCMDTMRELTTMLVCRDFLTEETPHGSFLVSDRLPMSNHHYVIPLIFCGHLQPVKMPLRLLTTTVASLQLAILASCKTDFFACTPPPTPSPPHKKEKISWSH